LRGLTPCGRYTDALTRFQDSEDDVADFTVAGLQRAIERADARLRLATTSDMRLSAAAAAAAAASAPAFDYTALAAAIAQHLPTGGQQRSAKATTSGQPIYCWTHGVAPHCSHSSHACEKRLPGHVAEATFTDRHGGWPHHTPAKSRDRASTKPRN
jgi:hypothetical protein